MKKGAGNGVRTRDLWLGKPTLYRLSYSRNYFVSDIIPKYFKIINLSIVKIVKKKGIIKIKGVKFIEKLFKEEKEQ